MSTALFFTLLKILYICLTLYSNLLTLHKYLIQNPTFFFCACSNSFADCRFWIFNYEKHWLRLHSDDPWNAVGWTSRRGRQVTKQSRGSREGLGIPLRGGKCWNSEPMWTPLLSIPHGNEASLTLSSSYSDSTPGGSRGHSHSGRGGKC